MAEILPEQPPHNARSDSNSSSDEEDLFDPSLNSAGRSGGQGRGRGRGRGRGLGRRYGNGGNCIVRKLKLRYGENAMVFNFLLANKVHEKSGAGKTSALTAVLVAVKAAPTGVRDQVKDQLTLEIVENLIRNYRKCMESILFQTDEAGDIVLNEDGKRSWTAKNCLRIAAYTTRLYSNTIAPSFL
jgi:hypothetical protein